MGRGVEWRAGLIGEKSSESALILLEEYEAALTVNADLFVLLKIVTVKIINLLEKISIFVLRRQN